MFERGFESLGKASEKHSGKLIILWIIIIVLLAPFASMLFGMTSYDVGSGIVPANSMANRADNLLSQYFPASAPSANSSNNLVIVTTGTNVNDASVISSYLDAQSLMSKYLSGQGIGSNISSIVTVEQSILLGFSSGALELMNGTYAFVYQLNGQLTELNVSLAQMVEMLYGIPAEFLSSLQSGVSANLSFAAINASLPQGTPSQLYFASFYQYFIQSYSPAQNYTAPEYFALATGAIMQAVQNATSPYYSAASGIPGLLGMSQSVAGNFTFGNFNLDTPSNISHYNDFAYSYSYSTVVPELGSNSTTALFLQSLDATPSSFFSTIYQLPQPASPSSLRQVTFSLAAKGLTASLDGSPSLSVNPASMGSYLSQLWGTTDISGFVHRYMQLSGFSGYAVVPSEYELRNLVGYDNSTTIIVISLSANLSASQTNDLESAAATAFGTVGGSHLYTSGSSVMNSQLATQSIDGMIRALVIGIVLSIFIVGIYFRSVVAAFLPLAMFGISAMSAFSVNALLYKYVLKTSISFITPTLLLILLLGLSTDYVVYIMSRYRNELRKGNPNPIVVSSKWAGHAVFTSGLTVSMSYVALWVSNVPIFSDSGLTNAIGVLLAVIVANTLLVSILHRGGRRIFWPSKIRVNGTQLRKGPMTKLSGIVIANKGKLFIVFVVVSLLSTYVYYTTPTNMDVFSLLPAGSGVTAINVVNQSFHGDYFDQAYIILQFNSPLLTANGYNQTLMGTVTAVENSLIADSHVSAISGPTFPFGYYVPYNLSGIPSAQQSSYASQMSKYIGSDSRYVLITFQLSALAWTGYSSSFVSSLPSYLSKHDGSSFKTYVGGLTEGLNDAYTFTDSSFTNMIPVLVVAILAVLAIQISSIFTPMRLVLMVLASVILALAITYIIIHSIYQLSLLIFLPMFTIVTLLAVGLDYDIFMVSRVREEVMKGKSDQEGIIVSMSENGGVIITLGAVLFATFASLLFSGIGLIEEIGVGLALGVLIDTFVSWPLFVPSVMLLLRRLNWWPSKLGSAEAREQSQTEAEQ